MRLYRRGRNQPVNTMRAARFRPLHAVLLLASVLLLSSCGSAVDFTSAAPSDAVVPYTTPVQQGGQSSIVGLHAKDGSEAWRMTIGASYNVGPLSVSGDVLYVIEVAAPTPSTPPPGAVSIIALRLSDGKTLWRTPLPPIGYDVSVNVDSSAVLIAATDALYALDPSSGTVRWHQTELIRPWPYLGSGVVVARLAGDEPDTASGLAAWRESDGTKLWQLNSSPDLNVVTNSAAVFGREQGVITARSLQTGHPLWHFPTGGDLHVGTLLAATDSIVLAQTYAPPAGGISSVSLVALDARTGKQLWTVIRTLYGGVQDGVGPLFGGAANGETMIYGWDGADLLGLRGSDGAPIWHATMPPYTPNQEQLLDGVLYVLLFPPSCELGCWFSAQNERLAALNPATGVPYWQRDLTEEAALASG